MSVLTPHAIARGFLHQYDEVGFPLAVQQLASFILEHRIHGQIDDILLSVEEQYQKSHGVIEAVATVAHPLTAALRTDLEQLIAEKTNAKTVVLHENVDTSVIGGVNITTSRSSFDLTVRSKLDRLRV